MYVALLIALRRAASNSTGESASGERGSEAETSSECWTAAAVVQAFSGVGGGGGSSSGLETEAFGRVRRS